MKRDFRFYKVANGDWYIDLPEWKGDPADLQMIQGADEWLDLVSNGDEVTLTIADADFDNAAFMTLIRLGEPNLGGGGNYFLHHYNGKDTNLNVCLQTKVHFFA